MRVFVLTTVRQVLTGVHQYQQILLLAQVPFVFTCLHVEVVQVNKKRVKHSLHGQSISGERIDRWGAKHSHVREQKRNKKNIRKNEVLRISAASKQEYGVRKMLEVKWLWRELVEHSGGCRSYRLSTKSFESWIVAAMGLIACMREKLIQCTFSYLILRHFSTSGKWIKWDRGKSRFAGEDEREKNLTRVDGFHLTEMNDGRRWRERKNKIEREREKGKQVTSYVRCRRYNWFVILMAKLTCN